MPRYDTASSPSGVLDAVFGSPPWLHNSVHSRARARAHSLAQAREHDGHVHLDGPASVAIGNVGLMNGASDVVAVVTALVIAYRLKKRDSRRGCSK